MPEGADGDLRARRRSTLILVAIAAAGLVVRLAYLRLVAVDHPLDWDATYYHLGASSLARGNGYDITCPILETCTSRPATFFGPLFSIVLASSSVLGFDTDGAHRVVAAVLGAAAVFLCGALGRRVAGDRVGYVAAALSAVYVHWIMLESALMSEALAVPLTILLLLCVYRALQRPTLAAWIGVGAVTGLLALTRSEGLLWLPFLVLPAALRVRSVRGPRRLALAAVAAVAAIAVVLPWWVHVASVTGSFSVAAGNGGVIGGANCDETYSGPELGGWVCDQTVEVEGARLGPGSVRITEQRWGQLQTERGLTYARAHAGRVPVVVAARELRAFSLLDPMAFEVGEKRARQLSVYQLWLYLPLGVAGLVLLRRRRVRVWPLVVPLGFVAVTVALAWGNQRLRISAEPSLLVGVAVVLATAWDRARPAAST